MLYTFDKTEWIEYQNNKLEKTTYKDSLGSFISFHADPAIPFNWIVSFKFEECLSLPKGHSYKHIATRLVETAICHFIVNREFPSSIEI